MPHTEPTLTTRFRESATRLPEPVVFGSAASPRGTLPLPLKAAGYRESPAEFLRQMTTANGHCGQ